jgi:hypothetical protein
MQDYSQKYRGPGGKILRDILLIFSSVMVSVGLMQYVPDDIAPWMLIIFGLVLGKVALDK